MFLCTQSNAAVWSFSPMLPGTTSSSVVRKPRTILFHLWLSLGWHLDVKQFICKISGFRGSTCSACGLLDCDIVYSDYWWIPAICRHMLSPSYMLKPVLKIGSMFLENSVIGGTFQRLFIVKCRKIYFLKTDLKGNMIMLMMEVYIF
jgi:hypothetical protein